MALRYFWNVLCHSKYTHKCSTFVSKIEDAMKRDIRLCAWFLDNMARDVEMLADLLLRTWVIDVRVAVTELIVSTVKCLREEAVLHRHELDWQDSYGFSMLAIGSP